MTAVQPTTGEAPRWLAPAPLRGMRAAFVLASRLPLGGFPYREQDWHWAAAHLPLVGIAVGTAAGLVFEMVRGLGLGGTLAATLALAMSVWLTGAFHEDGLADTADGIGGAHGGKSAIEIMKDSRIGTYGATALALSFAVRIAAGSELPRGAGFAFTYVHCLARVGPVWLLATQPQLSAESSKTRSLLRSSPAHVAIALAWAMVCSGAGVAAGWLAWPSAAAVPFALAGVTLACARYFRARLGGMSGDLLGAAEQAGELAGWLALLAAPAALAIAFAY